MAIPLMAGHIDRLMFYEDEAGVTSEQRAALRSSLGTLEGIEGVTSANIFDHDKSLVPPGMESGATLERVLAATLIGIPEALAYGPAHSEWAREFAKRRKDSTAVFFPYIIPQLVTPVASPGSGTSETPTERHLLLVNFENKCGVSRASDRYLAELNATDGVISANEVRILPELVTSVPLQKKAKYRSGFVVLLGKEVAAYRLRAADIYRILRPKIEPVQLYFAHKIAA